MAPPPGGPVDNDPPVVLPDAMRPERGAAAVPPDSTFVIVFSERTNRRSVMRALRIFPPVKFAGVNWAGDTLRLVPEDGWARNRGTLIRIEGSARDNRGNLMGAPFQTTFTTKSVPDSGQVTGRVWGGRELEQSRRLLVLAWTPADSLEEEERWPAAIVDAIPGKDFRLEGLDTALPWHVTAVIEGEGGLRGREPGGVELTWPDMIVFREGETEVALGEFLVGTLDTLGTVRGEVKTDSARVAVIVARPASEVHALEAAAAAAEPASEPSPPDSSTAPEDELAFEESTPPPGPYDDWIVGAPVRTAPIGAGDFTLRVPTGDVYRLGAFVDVDADSIADPDEPRVALERDVSLRFASTVEGLRFDLRGLAPWPVPETVAADSAGAAPDTTTGLPEEETGP